SGAESMIRSILIVCMGNICRSPMAEGMLRQAAREARIDLRVDSAGTEDYHVGSAPDRRACALAASRGTPIDDLVARQVEPEDFHRFDVILAADRRNLAVLQRMRPGSATAELDLLLPWAGRSTPVELPDPYYGDASHFE